MKTLLLPLFILVILCICFLVYVQYSTSELPERVATHFGADGTPNGWMSREKHTLFMSAFSIGISLLLSGLGFIIKFFPARFVSLPNRDYWLSPERREQTCLLVCRYMTWMGCITVAFFTGIQYSIVKANQSNPAKLPNELFWPLLIGFLVATTLWTIAFMVRFSKKYITEES